VIAATACTSRPNPLPTPLPQPSGQPTSLPPSIPAAAPRDCPIGLAVLRGAHVPTAMTLEVMKEHVPHWLPDGFGLIGTWHQENGAAWAMWADNDCRELTIFYDPHRVSATPGPQVGSWTVTADAARGCANAILGTARCLQYQTNASDGSLGIQAMGIDRSEGDRIAQSIPQ
jgi:hypothetical protein